MNCPKCPGKLVKRKIEHVEVDSCFVCEGIWFDAGELEKVIKADSKDFDFIDVGREEFDGQEIQEYIKNLDEKPSECPRCADGTLLFRSKYGGKHQINVDVCPKGHGLWLDGGEILELRHRGMVNLKDQLEFFLDVNKYIFSKNGFKESFRKIFKK